MTITIDGGPQPLVVYGYDTNNNRTSITVGGNTINASYDSQDRLTAYESAKAPIRTQQTVSFKARLSMEILRTTTTTFSVTCEVLHYLTEPRSST